MSDIENAPQEAAQEAVAKEGDQHEEAAIDIGSNKEDDVDATKETEPAVDGGEAGGSGKISPLVYFNSLSRVVMAAFLIAGGVYAIPDIFLDSPTEDFKFCAIFFMIGTGLFLTVALIDFKGTIGNGTVAMTNSSMYVIGAATLEAGSIAFYPGLDKSGEPLGQLLYVAGTCVVAFGLLWDIARLLRSGNVIPIPFIIALFSALFGAINFNYGANFLMPEYQTSHEAIAKGGRFFVVGGAFFMIHALAVVKATLF